MKEPAGAAATVRAGDPRMPAAGRAPRESGGPRDADQRREQMLRAALEVIAERGFPDTRIADVAERTGTSPALVIYYFKTKDQLLTEAIRYSEDAWYEAGTSADGGPPHRGRAARGTRRHELPARKRQASRAALAALAGPVGAVALRLPEVASVRQKFDERWRETIIRSMVLAGQEAGEFGPVDADDFAITLAALLDGLAVQIALEDPSVAAGARVRAGHAVRGRASWVSTGSPRPRRAQTRQVAEDEGGAGGRWTHRARVG